MRRDKGIYDEWEIFAKIIGAVFSSKANTREAYRTGGDPIFKVEGLHRF